MAKMTIDSDTCTRCGTCVATCPAAIFVQRDKEAVPGTTHETFCISCGHCVAICPVGATAHEDFPEGTVNPLDMGLLPSFEQVREMFRMRRSIRVFEDKPVERAALDQIIDAAQLAPTGHNVQSTEYIVVQDKDVLAKVVALTTDYMAKGIRQLRNPVLRTVLGVIAASQVKAGLQMLPELEMVVKGVELGEDPILRRAPCLIVFHARKNTVLPNTNAQLALQNATFAAQALGLGSFYTGFVLSACQRDSRIPELLAVPEGNVLYAGMTLGYPQYPFKNWIRRKPPRVKWIA